MDLPDVKDLAAAPTWLAITFVVAAIALPILRGLFPKLRDRKRHHHKHEHREHDPDESEPAGTRGVGDAVGVLHDEIEDLRKQRDRERDEGNRLQRLLDKERAESARKDVTIARLEAQLDVYRNQPNRGGQS